MALDKDWTLRPDGTVEAFPLRAVKTASIPKRGLVRIEYFTSEEAHRAGNVSALQLHLSPDEAREIARIIGRMADLVESSS